MGKNTVTIGGYSSADVGLPITGLGDNVAHGAKAVDGHKAALNCEVDKVKHLACAGDGSEEFESDIFDSDPIASGGIHGIVVGNGDHYTEVDDSGIGGMSTTYL